MGNSIERSYRDYLPGELYLAEGELFEDTIPCQVAKKQCINYHDKHLRGKGFKIKNTECVVTLRAMGYFRRDFDGFYDWDNKKFDVTGSEFVDVKQKYYDPEYDIIVGKEKIKEKYTNNVTPEYTYVSSQDKRYNLKLPTYKDKKIHSCELKKNNNLKSKIKKFISDFWSN